MDNDRKFEEDVRKPASYRYGDKLPAASEMLAELLEATDIQQLFESYYNLITIPVAIIRVENDRLPDIALDRPFAVDAEVGNDMGHACQHRG